MSDGYEYKAVECPEADECPGRRERGIAMCGPAVRCSACVPEVGPINFCPSCRAKVVSE